MHVPPSGIDGLGLDGRRVVSGGAHRVERPLVRVTAVQRAVVVHLAQQRALVMVVTVVVGQRLMAAAEVYVTVVVRRGRRRVTRSGWHRRGRRR